jgi:hypothetical protein
MPVTPSRRGADCDEYRVGGTNGFLDRGRERQPSFLNVRAHEILQTRFVNRNFATLERLDL